MSGQPILTSLLPSDPTLADLMEIQRKSVMLMTNCHAIGTVQSFNHVLQTATVTINYTRTYLTFSAAEQGYIATTTDYPVLVDCPVIFLGGGHAALTFPVAAGDECLVFFNDRDMDNWWTGNVGAPVATPRMHSFSDGIILVGLRSKPNVLLNVATGAVEIRGNDAATTKLSLTQANATLKNASGAEIGTDTLLVTVKTSLGGTLGTVLQAQITDLTTMATAEAAACTAQAAACTGPLAPLQPGFTAMATAFTALATQLALVATTIGEILA